MATNETLIPIPGRLHSVATEGHVAGANEIYDDNYGQLQDGLNKAILEEKEYTPANYSGMGRVVLQKNMVSGVNTLTQDMFYKGAVGSRVPNTNTIFVIKYDFTLGEDITVPANCVLEFDGGSINGSYTLTGQNTIIYNPIANCLIGVSLAGTFKGEVAHINWLHNSGEDISANMQILVNNYNKVIIDKGTFYVTNTVILRSGVTIEGEDREQSIIKASIERYNVNDMMYTMFSTAEVEVPWNESYPRWANLDNTDNEILYSDITIKNLHFDFDRKPSNFPVEGLAGKHCTAIALIDSRDCVVSNCDFIDYMEASLSTDPQPHKNNGKHCIQFYNTEKCLVTHCYSERVTLMMSNIGKYNEASFNLGYYSVGTWIETITSDCFHNHDNELHNVFWHVSMMSTNAKHGIIENNKIYHTLETGVISAFTFGHDLDISDASYGTFRNNYVNLSHSMCGVLLQRGVNLTIENNDITINDGDYEMPTDWASLRNINYACIDLQPHATNNTIIVSNNHLVHRKCHGIHISGVRANENNSLTIVNNSIDSYGACIFTDTSYTNCVVEILNNICKAFTYSIYMYGIVDFAIIENNKINSCCLMVGKITNNIFDFTDKIASDIIGNYVIQVTKLTESIKITNNVFKNIPSGLNSLIYNTPEDPYAGSYDDINFNNIFENNVISDEYSTNFVKLVLHDTSWKDIFIPRAISIGKGDHTGINPTQYIKFLNLFDTVLLKNVLWNGTTWVNLDGSALS